MYLKFPLEHPRTMGASCPSAPQRCVAVSVMGMRGLPFSETCVGLSKVQPVSKGRKTNHKNKRFTGISNRNEESFPQVGVFWECLLSPTFFFSKQEQYFLKTRYGTKVLQIQVASFSLIHSVMDSAEVNVGHLGPLCLGLTSLELLTLQIMWSLI